MATILLSAAGAAIGGAFGGGVLGLSTAVIGRAVGATIGRVIDQRLMGAGSDVVEIGKLSRYRVTGASEGAAVARSYARTRVGGQVIWSTQFRERVSTQDVGGKGGGGQKARTYRYSVSVAVALGEGPILRVGRIWADGIELARDKIDMRVYHGTSGQLPDPLIEAVEGQGRAPAYRDTAYVVIEDMELGPYGNRLPQLSFEIVRPTERYVVPEGTQSLSDMVRGVALVPGSGEYVLEPERVVATEDVGQKRILNLNTPGGDTDFLKAVAQLEEEAPLCRNLVLVVCWFGDDLRCGECLIKPKVEQNGTDPETLPWSVSGVPRVEAEVVPWSGGRPLYGGTPTDQSVIAAIQELRARGFHVTFYPFILMDQREGNVLPDPYSTGTGQAHLPWRGRITTSRAPGISGSPDGTALATQEVQEFFGQARATEFTGYNAGAIEATEEEPGDPGRPAVRFTAEEQEWSYRRFILHYAHICAEAGGVDAFCVGSEMRGLTQIRGANNSFPAVAEMGRLVSDVRGVVGAEVKLGYAADWSEYFGYQPQDGSGDVFFHLDPFWAHGDVDFIGIDNYMPLSDWRDGLDHLDAQDGVSAIHDFDYLRGNVAGGEGFDWYYPSEAARLAQVRAPIEDGAYGEPWVFRYKDLRGWWENSHHDRIGGVRQASPTAWVPESKPIWFTEFGCASVDKATNQPNKFVDPKSSESQLPWFSDGRRDELIQAQYLRAVLSYWGDPQNNPVSSVYGGQMLDLTKAHVWAWDTRPYPYFPNRLDLWSDGGNYALGHWLNGRMSHESLAAVIADICARCGLPDVDVSDVYGLVRGYDVDLSSGGRGALQPLLLAYGVDAAERDGRLCFSMRTGRARRALSVADLAQSREIEGDIERVRAPAAESPGRVRLAYIRAAGDFETGSTEAAFPGGEAASATQSELPLVLGDSEAQGMAERWLAEARVARDGVKFALPPSAMALGAGDVVTLGDEGLFRIDRVELAEGLQIDAVRVEPGAYVAQPSVEAPVRTRPFRPPVPVQPIFLDLPLLTGDEVPHAPHLAIAAKPWPGAVAVLSAPTDAGYALDMLIEEPATVGVTLDPLPRAAPGRWDRGPALRVRFTTGGIIASAQDAAFLSGANAFAIGDGSPDGWEIFQARDVELVDEGVFALSMRLRGQAGTDADMVDVRPAGGLVVLLDGALRQVSLPLSARGLDRHFRIGPADLSVDDPAMVHAVQAFDGIGLRPFAPAHLLAETEPVGHIRVRWTRRTRIGGDSWLGEDVPLGEEREAYRVRVTAADGAILRSTETSEPTWLYDAQARAADGLGAFVEVAQLSTTFGTGPFTRIKIDD